MKGVCPSVVTHRHQQRDQAMMKSIEDLIISMKGVCLNVK